jgi:hypothetical protein
MAEKHIINDNINKRDLDLILEVNRKAIEIETAVADQNEEVILLLNKNKEKHDKTEENIKKLEEKLDKIVKYSEEINKDLFRIQVLFFTGLLSLVFQIIQFFLKK